MQTYAWMWICAKTGSLILPLYSTFPANQASDYNFSNVNTALCTFTHFDFGAVDRELYYFLTVGQNFIPESYNTNKDQTLILQVERELE